MQLPVDIGEVLKIATDMKEVASTPISVSIYIDDTAHGALVGHVRSAFASAGEHTRVTISYLDEGVRLRPGEDMAVIVAGTASGIGAAAADLRENKVPVMIVTDTPEEVADRAKSDGQPIPGADIIAPIKLESAIEAKIRDKVPFMGRKAGQSADSDNATSEEIAIVDDTNTGAVPLNDETFKLLDTRMGKWIISACKNKDLAFALSFPFIRRPLAMESITATSLQNGAVGFVPFLPGADMPIMTLNQCKMTLQIATAYGQPLDKDRIKEIVAVVAGAFVARNIARSVTKVIPAIGWIVSGSMGFAATEAMGRALLEYFEAGGDIVGVASVMQTARDAAIETSKQVASSPAGKSAIAKLKDVAGSVSFSKN